jgi:hypothetical protein
VYVLWELLHGIVCFPPLGAGIRFGKLPEDDSNHRLQIHSDTIDLCPPANLVPGPERIVHIRWIQCCGPSQNAHHPPYVVLDGKLQLYL